MPNKADRKRPIQVKFFVDERELGLIKARMAQLGIENMSAYLRQVAIDGYEEKPNLPERREPKIPDSLSEDRLMFSSAGAQPISLKSFRGLGHFPNKIARVYKHEHCLLSAFRSWQVMRSGCRRALLARMASSGVGTHRICLLFCKEIPVVPRRISQV